MSARRQTDRTHYEEIGEIASARMISTKNAQYTLLLLLLFYFKQKYQKKQHCTKLHNITLMLGTTMLLYINILMLT